MSQFKVYHCDGNGNFSGNRYVAKLYPLGYTLVATVESPVLGQVFELTNHIDHDWQDNPEVTAHVRPARSTSVGDVVENKHGEAWMVAGSGWERI